MTVCVLQEQQVQKNAEYVFFIYFFLNIIPSIIPLSATRVLYTAGLYTSTLACVTINTKVTSAATCPFWVQNEIGIKVSLAECSACLRKDFIIPASVTVHQPVTRKRCSKSAGHLCGL